MKLNELPPAPSGAPTRATGHIFLKGAPISILQNWNGPPFHCVIVDLIDIAIAPRANNTLILAGALPHVMEKNSHLFLFCEIHAYPGLRWLFKRNGFEVYSPLIWHKVVPRMIGAKPGLAPLRSYETLLFITRGKKPLNETFPDVISVPDLPDKAYEEDKPSGLYEFLLKRTCKRGERVLHVHCGSGNVFKAASTLGLLATGTEDNDELARVAAARARGTS